MIGRYTRPEMGAVWSEQRKLENWLAVELAVTDALAEEGVVPAEDAEAIRASAAFTVEAVKEREKVTDHDVAAFVDVVAASVGEAGPLGAPRADLLRRAGHRHWRCRSRRPGRSSWPASAPSATPWPAARASTWTPCAWAAPTACTPSPPRSASSWPASRFEAQRNLERLERAVAGASVGALSGAVGTYAANGPELEAVVLERLGLEREDVSTQVVARDRHAELLSAVALAGAGLERFATEIRHLQRTEVREVEEPFRAGQKGSSAMPHKRNPITTERLTGIARLLRGYAQSGLENVALWHERDISHCSVERVALPDATILLDYGLSLGVRVVEGMTVHADRMRANLDLTHGALFSQRALLALVESGRSRDDAYRIVQENAQRAWDTGTPFRDLLAEAAPELDLDAVFDPSAFVRHAADLVGRLDARIAGLDYCRSAERSRRRTSACRRTASPSRGRRIVGHLLVGGVPGRLVRVLDPAEDDRLVVLGLDGLVEVGHLARARRLPSLRPPAWRRALEVLDRLLGVLDVDVLVGGRTAATNPSRYGISS